MQLKSAILGSNGYIGSVLREYVHAPEYIGGHVEVIYDLAAIHSVTESVREPQRYMKNNIEWPLKASCDHYIFASSIAAKNPENPYGFSKLAAEEIIKARFERYTILRLHNVVGGNDPNPRFIPIIKSSDHVTIHGGDFPTPDGTAIRTYVHVRDVCKYMVRAANLGLCGTFEVGAWPASNKEIVEALGKPYTIGPRRAGEPAALICDTQMPFEPRSLHECLWN